MRIQLSMELSLKEILSKHDLQLSDVKSKSEQSIRSRIATQLIDWKLIAHYLGLAQVRIHAIHVDNENEEQRRTAFLEEWAEMNGDGATYMKLAEAFYERGRLDLVDQLCKMIKRAMKRPSLRPIKNTVDSVAGVTSIIKVREDKQFSLTWKEEEHPALRTMSRWCDAVVNGSAVYFLPDETYNKNIVIYNSFNRRWSQFGNRSPHTNSVLAVINESLTTVGGGGFPYTNKLYTFTEEGRYGLWTERYPPMPTKRQWTSALNTRTHLIVAGGWGSANEALRTVEVLNLQTREWYTADSLPESLYHASMSLCGDQVYILGGYDVTKTPTEVVYTCSLGALLNSMSSHSTEQLPEELIACIWERITDLPVTESTATSLHGTLLAVGGRDSSTLQSSTAVYKYSVATERWVVASHMTTARHLCFAAALPNNRLLVVGGETGKVHSDSVEVATSILF